MKRKWMMAAGVLVTLVCITGARAQDAGLKAQVESLYGKVSSCYAAKDAGGILALLSDDFQVILSGGDRRMIQSQYENVFSMFDAFQSTQTPVSIAASGAFIRVVRNERIQAKPLDGAWKEIASRTVLDYLVRQGGALKIARSGEIDITRVNILDGQVYRDNPSGLSLTVPDGWELIPGVHPSMKEVVYVLAPDRSSIALAGYLKTPGIDARQAAEGDEALTKALSSDGVYELYTSGQIGVGGREGYEIESRFTIPGTSERHRRRVYFKAQGSLYVLCFDAIPSSRWDEVKDGFQRILDSIKVED